MSIFTGDLFGLLPDDKVLAFVVVFGVVVLFFADTITVSLLPDPLELPLEQSRDIWPLPLHLKHTMPVLQSTARCPGFPHLKHLRPFPLLESSPVVFFLDFYGVAFCDVTFLDTITVAASTSFRPVSRSS